MSGFLPRHSDVRRLAPVAVEIGTPEEQPEIIIVPETIPVPAPEPMPFEPERVPERTPEKVPAGV